MDDGRAGNVLAWTLRFRGTLQQGARVGGEHTLYEVIGRTYTRTRREDARVAAPIHLALTSARSVVNVGAGAGSYEPADRPVVAVEPSPRMLGQRGPGRSRSVVRGVAEALPFPDGAFDAALAVLTVHHWSDPVAGLREMRRVARRQVVLFFEPLRTHRFWALDYFPEALDLPSEQSPPGEDLLREVLDVTSVAPVLVPRDCTDGFGVAYWARPAAYADPEVQAGMSWLALLPAAVRERGSARLLADLASGAWEERYGHLLGLPAYDGGYRLAVAGPGDSGPGDSGSGDSGSGGPP
jgi:SAM-dependent methyltransferase